MSKKPFALWKGITIIASGVILSTAMIIGTSVAKSYESLLDVYFTKSDYKPIDGEKIKCEEVAREGIVLIQNKDNFLPLNKDSINKVALLGQDSVDFVYGGSGSGSVDAASAPTLKQSFERAGFTVDQTCWDFYKTGPGSSYRKSVTSAQGTGYFKTNEVPADKYNDEFKNAAKSNDFIVCSIGRSGGESFDLPLNTTEKKYQLTGGEYLYLQIDDNEKDMLKLACQSSENVILLVNSNNALELGFLNDAEYKNIKSVLWVPGVGQEGLYAVGDIIAGNVNPSGKLVDSWAYDSTSAPSFANMGSFSLEGVEFPDENSESKYNRCKEYIVYEEGIYVGYKYYETRYEDTVLSRNNVGTFDYSKSVQFPFGFGLTYSDFTWSDFSVKENTDNFEISLKVTNNGQIAGKDVVEIYAQSEYTDYDIANKIEKSSVQLVGYAKTKLLANNEEENVVITVDKESLATYDSNGAKTYIMDAGQYYLTAANDAHSAINNILSKKGVGSVEGTGSLVYDGFHPSSIDSTTYSTSKETGKKISNQFEDCLPEYYGEEAATIVSRNNWDATLPSSSYKNGSWQINETVKKSVTWNRSDDVVKNDLEMPINDANTNYTIHDAVVNGVVKDYDDPIWDNLVNQLSAKKMLELIRMGGYATIGLKSIDLPSTQDKDGPSGISGTLVGGTSCMAWPVETMMAATWNDELIEEMGVIIGDDSIRVGVTGWYAPGADIHRSPYSGRNFEYYSEDGFLSGKIGAAETRGVRSRGVLAYMKHFALNDQETGRGGGIVMANEQAIREIYLKGFELIVREGKCTGAMAGMNRVGTAWAGANKNLMTNVLRNEWGFKGCVITDQASVSAMFYEDIISGLWAGNDMWLNTGGTYWELDSYYNNATSNGRIMQSAHKAAKNIIYAVVTSNANSDMGFKVGPELSVGEEANFVLPWRVWLGIADGVVFTLSLAGIGLSIYLLFFKRKPLVVEAE